MENESSRRKAQKWPYPRYREFEDSLRLAAASWFREKGYPVHPRYPYILDDLANWHRNIIVPEVAKYIAFERKQRESLREGFPLHKYAHHGLSSQAMLFNLIGPLIVSNDLEPLASACQTQGFHWPFGETGARFEYENRSVFNEDSGQPTSVDLAIGANPKTAGLYLEAKLTEKEFGGCSVFASGDCDGCNPTADLSRCYLHFIGRRYWTLLEKYGFLTGPLRSERLCPFSIHYQFFREVLFALELGGSFVLLYDSRNPTFLCQGTNDLRGLIPLLLSFVPSNLHCRIGTVTIQQVVSEIRRTGRHNWIHEFEKKYGLS